MTDGQRAGDNLRQATQGKEPPVPTSWLVGLWLIGFACLYLWWAAFNLGLGGSDLLIGVLYLFAGLLGVPILIAAHQLNGRPRQTLNWMTPSQKLAEALQ